jgi:DNA invertase Pin-like site-specific DNA recombinase
MHEANAEALARLDAVRRQGRIGGRPTVMDPDRLAAARARHTQGQSPTQVAGALGVSLATIYRHLDLGKAHELDIPDQISARSPDTAQTSD